MSVRVTKPYEPALSESVTCWKWFVLQEDGNLGFAELHFPLGAIEGQQVKLGEPMENEHGFCVFATEQEAKKWEWKGRVKQNWLLVPVMAIDRLCDGFMGNLAVRKYRTILVKYEEMEEIDAKADETIQSRVATSNS